MFMVGLRHLPRKEIKIDEREELIHNSDLHFTSEIKELYCKNVKWALHVLLIRL